MIARRIAAAGAVASVLAIAAPAPAQDRSLDRERAAELAPRSEDAPPSALGPGSVLPEHLVPSSSPYFEVGVGIEQFGSDLGGSDTLPGVTVQLRNRAFGGHLLFEAKPDASGYHETRFLLGLGGRVHFSLLGARLSYGVGAHAELRLEDHYWLIYGTPAELGGVLLSRGSWEIELFAGVRHPLGGSLVQHFLVDPNGFDNESAADRLDELKRTWIGFARLVFSRRID